MGSRGTLSEHLETQLRNLSERVEDSKRHVVLCIRPNDEPRQKGAGFVNQTVRRWEEAGSWVSTRVVLKHMPRLVRRWHGRCGAWQW